MGRKPKQTIENDNAGGGGSGDEKEFGAVSIAILTEHFGGDAARAAAVMNEIGSAGGYGRATGSSVFAIANASDRVKKAVRDIIKKAGKK